eukprot:6280243-Pyramimonas_sp.AAC.1
MMKAVLLFRGANTCCCHCGEAGHKKQTCRVRRAAPPGITARVDRQKMVKCVDKCKAEFHFVAAVK